MTGGSGGGAPALACGAVLPTERVERSACAVGLAPYGPGGLPHEEWIAGQTPENVQEIEWALDGEEALARGLTASQADLAERLAAHLPTATVQVNAEGGHTGTDPEAEITRELRWLRGA